MKIEDILLEVNEKGIEDIVEIQYIQSLKSKKSKLTNSEKNFINKKFSNFKNFGKCEILKTILVYAIWEPDEAIDVARKKGIFRYSAWDLEENNVESILGFLKQHSSVLNFSKENCRFIEMKLELNWFFIFYRDSEEQLKKLIKKHHRRSSKYNCNGVYVEEALFKELLVYAEILFYSHNSIDMTKDRLNKDSLSGYTIEEITESISYLIFLYDSTIGIKEDHSYTVDPKFVRSSEIEKFILIGCRIIQLKEWELLIDYFKYDVESKDNSIRILHKNELFEKSIRLGNVKRDMQQGLSYMENFKIANKEAVSLSEISGKIKEGLGSDLISVVDDGNLSRYRFEIPQNLICLFNDKNLFLEEWVSVRYYANEQFTDIQNTLDKKITDNCTLDDIIKFHRVFLLFYTITSELLFEQPDESMIIRSLIPFMRDEQLIDLISNFVGDNSKSNELLSFFTYAGNTKLDLQYTPLLKASGGIIFSTSMIAKSNLIRNCIAHSYSIKNQIVNNDPLETLVLECKKIFELNHPEYIVFKNKKFSYLRQHGEIDVLVVSEKDIIIIECKSPFSPINNFEMRATYDYMIKAAKQLNLSKAALSDCSFRERFLKSLGIDNHERNIYTCIILGNRLFNGYTIENHPVRYIKELDMILNNGHIYSEAGRWRVWENEKYSHSDSIEFLSDKYKLGLTGFNAMNKIEESMLIEDKKIIFETYAFDFIKSIEQFDKNFFLEEKNDEFRMKFQNKTNSI